MGDHTELARHFMCRDTPRPGEAGTSASSNDCVSVSVAWLSEQHRTEVTHYCEQLNDFHRHFMAQVLTIRHAQWAVRNCRDLGKIPRAARSSTSSVTPVGKRCSNCATLPYACRQPKNNSRSASRTCFLSSSATRDPIQPLPPKIKALYSDMITCRGQAKARLMQDDA